MPSESIMTMTLSGLPCELPAGYSAAGISPQAESSALRVCVIVDDRGGETDGRSASGGAGSWAPAGRIVVLRDLVDGQVFLGALVDQAGLVHRWLEVSVQTGMVDPLDSGAMNAVFQEGLTNRLLDARWATRAKAMQTHSGSGVIWTGAEDQHPQPVYLVRGLGPSGEPKWTPVHPVDRSGAAFVLCQDEQKLEQQGLPGYATTLHRFLVAGSKFVNVGSPEADERQQSDPPSPEVLGVPAESIAFNPGGGLLTVCGHEPMSLERYLDAVSGSKDAAPLHLLADRQTREAAGRAGVGEHAVDGWLYAGQAGRWTRVSEILHLKLRALADAVASVRSVTQAIRCPLLSLDASSFRVRHVEPGPGLPSLWSARTVLVEGGEAAELPIGKTSGTYFVALRRRDMSTYRPTAAERRRSGEARVRVLKVTERGERATDQSLQLSVPMMGDLELRRNDLLNIKATIDGHRRDLYAIVDRNPDPNETFASIDTIAQTFDPPVSAKVAGQSYVAAYRVVPLMSSPFDLHALAVLCVRALLAHAESDLPETLGELDVLVAEASRLANQESLELPARIREVLKKRERLLAALGPQRVLHPDFGPVSPDEAMGLVTPEVWCDVLAMIVRMFPAMSPDSTCQDLGQADRLGVHLVYDRAMNDLESLIVRTRAQLLSDQIASREIRDVLVPVLRTL